MGRFFDKNLNVTSVNTYSSFSAVVDIRKGREGMVFVREKHLRAREKGGRGTLSSPLLSLGCALAPKSLSIPSLLNDCRASYR